MTRNEWLMHCSEVAKLLGAVLKECRSALDPERLARVEEFLSANELGLAHDELRDATTGGEVRLSDASAMKLDEAGRRMKLRP